ncbi:MAG: hypothetical protein JST85_00625 [Acidobacteria bacterium]|nr:hypothetical protein [Acidobacteriota bacterium]
MRIIRRTQILWETRQIVVTSGTPRNALGWCTACAATTIWLDPTHAAAWRNVPLSQLQLWLATGHLHTIPPANPTFLICLNSLLKFVEES